MKKDDLQPYLHSPPPPHPPESAAPRRDAPAESDIFQQESRMTSRFVDAHQEVLYSGYSAGPRIREFHELIYCVSGSADELAGSERFHLSRGDILSVSAGVSHALSIPENLPEPHRRYVLRCSQEYSSLINAMFLGDSFPSDAPAYVIRTSGSHWEFLGEYFRRCVQECEQRQFRWDATVFGIATELSVQMVRFWRGEQHEDASKPELLDRIMAYVEGHLSEKITVSDIAARFWVSQSTVSQLFRKKMGVSFYRYVTLRRLNEAKVLIRSGIPMEQVSISVGFQDYSSFYRAFKSEFGIPPSQYLKSG